MSTAQRTRVPKGVSTGGQFAAEHRPEASGVGLTAAPTSTPVAHDAGLPTGNWAAAPTKDRAKAMMADLNEAVAEVVSSGRLAAWMDSMRTNGLSRWSMRNRALVVMQLNARGIDVTDPEQVHLMGFRQWETVGRRVKKGAKAVYVVVPTTRVRKDREGKPMLDEHGNQLTYTAFQSGAVFNVTDTEGDPLPTAPVTPPTGQVRPGVITGLRDRVAAAGYAYLEKDIAADPARGTGTLGYTSPEGYVVVDGRLSEAQKASTIAHELAHIKCGHLERISEYRQHRGQMETEAEMTAYLVNRELGMEAEDAHCFSAGYVAGWAQGDPKVVTAAMDRAMRSYMEITSGDWPADDTDEVRRAPH